MPTYEFECPSCHQIMDIVVRLGDDREVVFNCEECEVPMKRRLSLPSVVFNGSGWAKKDRRGGQG